MSEGMRVILAILSIGLLGLGGAFMFISFLESERRRIMREYEEGEDE